MPWVVLTSDFGVQETARKPLAKGIEYYWRR